MLGGLRHRQGNQLHRAQRNPAATGGAQRGQHRREVAPSVDIGDVQLNPGLGTAPTGDTPERVVAEGEADLAEPPARLLPATHRTQQRGRDCRALVAAHMPGHRLRGAGLPSSRPHTAATAVTRGRLRTPAPCAITAVRAIAHVSDTRIGYVIRIWTRFRVRGTLRTASHAASSLLGTPGCRVRSSTAQSNRPDPPRPGRVFGVLATWGYQVEVCSCGVRLLSRSSHADRGTTPSPISLPSSRPGWAATRAARFRRREISTSPLSRRNRPMGVGRRLLGPGRLGTRSPPWRLQVEQAPATAIAADGTRHARWRAPSPGHVENTAGPT